MRRITSNQSKRPAIQGFQLLQCSGSAVLPAREHGFANNRAHSDLGGLSRSWVDWIAKLLWSDNPAGESLGEGFAAGSALPG